MATWIDWKGKLPTGYQAARRTRMTRSQMLGENLHVIPQHPPYTNEWRTLCGVHVQDEDDHEFWSTEQEVTDWDLPPFPDDMKVCRTCNARKRKLADKGGE